MSTDFASQDSESPHKNQTRHVLSGCNGICLDFMHIYLRMKPDIYCCISTKHDRLDLYAEIQIILAVCVRVCLQNFT